MTYALRWNCKIKPPAACTRVLCLQEFIGGKNVHTEDVFSSENSSASTGKKEVWCISKACFQGKKEENTYTQKSLQGGFWDPFVQHWCIELGLLNSEGEKVSGSSFGSCWLLGRAEFSDPTPFVMTAFSVPRFSPKVQAYGFQTTVFSKWCFSDSSPRLATEEDPPERQSKPENTSVLKHFGAFCPCRS